MSEIYEVASFYAHFHIVKEGIEEVSEITIKVCDSVTCAMYDAEKLYNITKLKYKNLRVEKAPCMGRCNYAPIVEVNHNHILNADNNKISKAITEKKNNIDQCLLFFCRRSDSGEQVLNNLATTRIQVN